MEITLGVPLYGATLSDSINHFFGVNSTLYRAKFGIPGHNALDWQCSYGDPVLAMHDGVVESITYDTPHGTSGNGIYVLSHDGRYSTNYWHLSGFHCKVGDSIKKGTVIGLAGNSGFVFPRPAPLTPHLGTHLHAGLRIHGLVNDYKSFVDPLPYLYNEGQKLRMRFTRNLYYGRAGDDVAHLQSILKLEGLAKDYEPIGYFGRKTLRDVMRLQKRYNITPPFGYVGDITKTFISKKYFV